MKLLKILPVILIVLISGCTQVSETNQSEEVQGEEENIPSLPQPSEGELQGEVIPPIPELPEE